ncbi:unnamed protein product, partial [Musa banksii]
VFLFIPEERSEAAATSSPLQGSANPESDEPERDEEKQEELHRGAIKESERKEEKERKELQSGGKIEVPGRDEENGQKELEDVAKIVEPKRNEQNVPRDLEYGDKQHIWEKLDKDEIDHIFASLEQCKTRNSQFGEDRTNFNEIYLALSDPLGVQIHVVYVDGRLDEHGNAPMLSSDDFDPKDPDVPDSVPSTSVPGLLAV